MRTFVEKLLFNRFIGKVGRSGSEGQRVNILGIGELTRLAVSMHYGETTYKEAQPSRKIRQRTCPNDIKNISRGQREDGGQFNVIPRTSTTM